MLQNGIQSGYLHGLKASRNGPTISHMLFADGSLLFCKAQVEKCHAPLSILKYYEKALWLTVNFQKSAVAFSKGIYPELKSQIT